MSLIKKLIQRLLDSRTTPAEAIHADRINLYTESTFSADTFTAPRDGFVRVWAKVRDGIAGTALGLNVSTNGGEQGISRFAFTGPSADNSIVHTWPIQKGETIRIEGFNLDIQLRTFFDAIGGGYNRFVRRALPCLRPSFNFSLKNSLLAEATGFPTNPIQLFKRRISHLQRQESGFLSSLLATGGSASKGLPRKFCLATGRFGRGAIQQRHLIKAFVFLSQKAGLWPTYYRQTPRAHMSSLFRVSAINSFQTGGALC